MPVRTATVARDLAVDLKDDRPGLLAKAASAIASGGLNLDGFAETDGVLHILTPDARAARLALESVGLRVVGDIEVVVVQAENRPGTAAIVFGRLADAEIKVQYTYVATGDRMVIAADRPQAAVDVLRRIIGT
jgi:hypothetical protein